MFFEELPEVNGANFAVQFLISKSQSYFEPTSYLQKHKNLNTASKTIIGTLQIILAPILLFILWVFFRYPG
jgi:hypothetical protein